MKSKQMKKNNSIKGFIHRIFYGSSELHDKPQYYSEETPYASYPEQSITNSNYYQNEMNSRKNLKNSSFNSSSGGFKNEMEDWLNHPIFGLDVKKDFSDSLSNSPDLNQEKLNKVENDLQQIKSMIEKMSLTTQSSQKSIIDINQQLSIHIVELLKDFDFSKEFQEQWYQYLIKNSLDNYEISKEKLYEFIQHEVRRLVYLGCDTAPKVHVFVGPPGVGKTTTIAKIASNEILQYQRKVGLITVDTYRIGAIEQLKTYASILNVPIKVVHNTEELKQALIELEDCDRIIIDSMGRTHRDYDNLKELKELFSILDRYTCYLVLSMSTKYRQLIRIMTEFKYLNYNHLILTKLDESERNENILNIFYQFQYPVAYLCTGQEVPTDIEVPTFKRVLELIWGEVNE